MITSDPKLYEKLFNLLGTRSDSADFKQLVRDIGEPSHAYEADNSVIYEFYEFGFGLTCNRANNRVWMMGFEYATPAVKSAAVKPFPEALHAGIMSTDCAVDVEFKLGVKPKSFKGSKTNTAFTGKYELSPLYFTCIFESSAGPLTGMTVHSIEARTAAARQAFDYTGGNTDFTHS